MPDTDYTLNPLDDPAGAERIIREAMEESRQPPAQEHRLRPLPVTQVHLCGGFETEDGNYVYDVEVRELTGEDEEAIGKQPQMARVLMTIINRATVRIGDQQATPAALDQMLSGDRELVLLQIRKATYGSTEELTLRCPGCGTDQQVTLDLDKDITVKSLDDPGDRYWEMTLRAGPAELCLPNGVAQRKVATASSEKSLAELNTLLIGECLHSLNGLPSLGVATARGLGLADRDAILKAIVERQPGPRLGEVVKQCESCNQDIPVDVNLALLFRL